MNKLMTLLAMSSLLIAPGCIGWCKEKFGCCKPKHEKSEKQKNKKDKKVVVAYQEKE